ncbi:MAG: hypothetical protein HN522_02520 [Flavobacteriales bacterium]|jgi:hypothetical protein|nr:hypothetical protein [Flavobacteriales bacterium]MBT5090460.1 hypothetical protein [Flavobacteriales bacterium]MBT5749939.1 hypothetical protein [Flavobacteriales bacterium]
MSTGLLHLHHYLPYLFFIVLIISIVRAALNKIPDVKKDIFLTLTLIFAHIQLLLGLVLLVNFISIAGVQMGEAANRFVSIEHPLMMIIAVLLITIGKVKAKKATDNTKGNKTVFSYFIIALVLVVLRTPWDKLFLK